jgi:DNA-directed RNA polymerase specialized sigma24 family protein
MHRLVNELIVQIAEENEGEELLLRDLRAEAMSRLERSAITPSDFKILTNAWDLGESNRRKKDEKYTVSLNSFTKATDTEDSDEIDMIVCTDTVFPIPLCYTLRTRYWRQIISGDFLDYIYDCAYEMYNYASSKHVSRAINRLTDNQKEIFYMIVIEGKSARQIAAYRNQTLRNINKIYAGALKSIHKFLEPHLKNKSESNTNDNNNDYKKGKSEK